jgi:hypothetical protein
MIGNSSLTAVMPSATASCSLGTAANPFSDVYMNGSMNGASVVPRVSTTTSIATLAIDSSLYNQAVITAQAVALTIAAPTNPVDGQKLVIRIKDNGTSRTIAWNGVFRAIGVTLPVTTTISKIVYGGCIYNSTDTKWDVVAVTEEA